MLRESLGDIMARLGDYVKIRTGKLDANAASEKGQYPFFTCSVEPLKIDTYSYDCECVLVAGNGDLNVKYYNGKFDAYQRTYIIESIDKSVLSVPYLYCFLNKYVETLRKQAIGGVIKYIKLGNLTEAQIPLCSLGEQEKIVNILNKVNKVIATRKQQLQQLDELVKARFVEMFGDPVANPMKWDMPLIEDVVANEKNALKAGPFGSALKKEYYVSSGYKIYGQEQVISGDHTFGDYYIDEERYKLLENCAVQAGDVLISLVGTYGKLLIMPEKFEPGIINPRLMKITFDKKKVNPFYFQHYFQSDSLKKALAENTHGGTMDILNLGIVRKLVMPLPPIELQNQFVTFVEQVDKSKFAVQKALDEAQTLFDSLMQEYFG